MAFAPDKNDPYPKPKPKPTGNNNGGGNGGGNPNTIGFAPGQVKAYVDQQVAAYGGDPAKWEARYREIYSPVVMPDYSWEKRGGGNRGGNNPGTGPGGTNGGGKPDQTGGGFTPSSPRNKMAPMAAQMPTQGFLNVGGIAPTLGLLGRPRQPASTTPGLLPPEIQLMLSQRR